MNTNLENNYNFYKSYFHFVNDFKDGVREKNLLKLGLGVAKLASYATVIVPIIFSVGLLISKSRLNKPGSGQKVSDVQSTSLKFQTSPEKLTQEELIRFVKDNVNQSNINSCQKAFGLLTIESQVKLFSDMAENSNIGQIFDAINETAEFLFIKISKNLKDEDLLRLTCKLEELKELKYVRLDFSDFIDESGHIKALIEKMRYDKTTFFKNIPTSSVCQNDYNDAPRHLQEISKVFKTVFDKNQNLYGFHFVVGLPNSKPALIQINNGTLVGNAQWVTTVFQKAFSDKNIFDFTMSDSFFCP